MKSNFTTDKSVVTLPTRFSPMSQPKSLLFFFLWTFCLGTAISQPGDGFRRKSIFGGMHRHQLDTLSIDERFFQITGPDGQPLDSAFYQLDPLSATLFLTVPQTMHGDSLRVVYRVLPLLLSKPVYLRTPQQIYGGGWLDNRILQRQTQRAQQGGLLDFPGIQSSGSISRGIAMGNRQDLSVRSEMNLQLSGALADDIHITAVISDQDIPFQPDGTTRQLNEFDRVFIQIESAGSQLIAGDFELQQAESHFLRLSRRAQGAKGVYNATTHVGSVMPGAQLTISAAGAVSKGNFARNQLQAIEGNQGPYRLMGANNENFIMVLSGTERVFIDGQLLTRGSDQDYVIDYNMAEITFTSRILISAQRRIVVEFEYANRNYARSMMFAAANLENQNNTFRLQVFSEQDHKFQSLFRELSQEQQQIMAGVGDNIGGAFSWNVQNIGFHPDRVMYRMTDSLGVDSVFVVSTDPQRAVYQLGFTFVGQGKGNYRQLMTAANGRVFEWVAPIDGRPQGTHEPISQLVTPKQNQMVSIGHEHRFSAQTKGSIELSLSNNDLNLFSDLDHDNDVGYGLLARFSHIIPFEAENNVPWNIGIDASHELISADFREIDRIRPVEFERDWNLGNPVGGAVGHLSHVAVQVNGLRNLTAGYKFYSLQKGPDYSGFRNHANMRLQLGKATAFFDGSLLSSSGFQQSRFYRHRTGITFPFLAFNAGFEHNNEFNRVWVGGSDSLFASSRAFDDWLLFLRSQAGKAHQFEVFHRFRNQQAPRGEYLTQEFSAKEYGFNYRWAGHANHNMLFNLTHRAVRFPNMAPDASLAGRLELTSRWFGGAVASGLFYDAGTGVQRKREYVYMEVPASQGVFAWVDYNGNGVMELDEFEIARFPDQARFIRVFIPTEEFVRVFSTGFTGSLALIPELVWSKSTGIRGFLSRFENRANLRIDKQKQGGLSLQNLNPWSYHIADTLLVALNHHFRNTLTFNRRGRVFSADGTFTSSSTKALLSNGFETRTNRGLTVSPRFLLNPHWSFSLQAALRESQNASEFFDSRNFTVTETSLNPMLSFQSDDFWRITVFHRYALHEQHVAFEKKHATITEWGSEIRLSFATVGSLNARFQVSDINFPFATNNPAAFQILQGLAPGTNTQLSLTWQHRLSAWMHLEFSYHARKSPAVRVIHTGAVQLRAAF